jgi:hypothetical protein
LCDYYVNPFAGIALGEEDEDGRCLKPGHPERFKRKIDGEISTANRCDEHTRMTNDQWDFIDECLTGVPGSP